MDARIHSGRRRRRLGRTHLVLIVLLALVGAGGTYAVTLGSASAGQWQPGTFQEGAGGDQDGGDGQNNDGQNEGDNGDGQEGLSLERDFAPIGNGQGVDEPAPQGDASTGTFTSVCGTNQEGHRNPDNFIVAPGVSNGAQHMHDYVGNVSADAFSTDDSLQASGTTCGNGDQSSYYWPVLRLLNGTEEEDANADGGGNDGNVGEIVTPFDVDLQFRGNPVSKVTEMPRFLRVITGDAKSVTNGTANARASWTCTGSEDRRLTDKYPICENDSDVVRVLDFPSCWDGQNTDSANHRDHIVFPDSGSGACPDGTSAVPQLRMFLAYDIPGAQEQLFAIDSFPDQAHQAVTDHADFVNVMPDDLMREAVACINDGRNCG